METLFYLKKELSETAFEFSITGVPTELRVGDSFHISLFTGFEESDYDNTATVYHRLWDAAQNVLYVYCYIGQFLERHLETLGSKDPVRHDCRIEVFSLPSQEWK